jgi:TRAP-type C4-dicarboxylate transport system permease small subunit
MINRILRPVAKFLTDISAFWLLGVMILVGVDVTMRFFFSKTIPGCLEISEQTVILITFFSFAYTGMLNRHIRTEAILNFLPPKMRSIADIIGILLMITLLSLLIVQTTKDAWLALSIREVRMGLVPIPIYPVKIAIPIGLFIALLYYTLKLFGLDENLDVENNAEEEK